MLNLEAVVFSHFIPAKGLLRTFMVVGTVILDRIWRAWGLGEHVHSFLKVKVSTLTSCFLDILLMEEIRLYNHLGMPECIKPCI